MAKGIIRRMTTNPKARKSSIFSSFVEMYTKLTEMLNIIEDIMKIISIALPKFDEFDLLINTFNKF